MKELFTLGNLYISDFLEKEQEPEYPKAEMKMVLEESSGVVKLDKCVDPSQMYGKYWYRSGISDTMKKELSSIVSSVQNVINLRENDVWLDIASNDGTLLSFVPKSMIRLGIDPADSSFRSEALKHANEIVQDFFSVAAYESTKYGKLKAKVITSIAMFYDLENPEDFLKDIREVMDDDGLWVLQLSYTPLMLKQMAFDNICHEHVYYYSLFNLKRMFEKNGFKIVDCQLNDVNGGSFRVYVMKDIGDDAVFSTQPHRDVCNFRVKSILAYEKTLNLDHPETWKRFYDKMNFLKEEVVSFIKEEKEKGKTVWGYGASTKGNTLLQYFGLDHTLIDGIAERSVQKFGLKTIGTNIPIYSESEMRKINPDYLLVLPWHFISEFIDREKEYLRKGGKFIVPCPKFEIIGRDNLK
jgi:hypothetical protein